MRIVIASGKGGTGKTTVATNLAYVASLGKRTVAYADCDVEEPNGHLFLAPQWLTCVQATRPVPRVDETKCTHCGSCAQMCRHSAIVPLDVTVLVYPELCHGCGGCSLVCPSGAITEVPHGMGTIETGRCGSICFLRGTLNVGEAASPPLIRQVKLAIPIVELTIIDAPPGTSCPVIEAVRGSDLVLLITEPTPFGLNDLALAVDMVRALRLPMGVVINRCDSGDRKTVDYCHANGLEIMAQIPDDRRIAEAYSRGELTCAVLPVYRTVFKSLSTTLCENAQSLAKSAAAAERNRP